MNRRISLMPLVSATASGRAASSSVEPARIDRVKVHAPAGKARFLRGKLETHGTDVAIAEQSIERIAFASIKSGQTYRIRLADAREVARAAVLGSLPTALERR